MNRIGPEEVRKDVVHKLLEGRDSPIKGLVATVSFAVEPQESMGEMLP